MGRTLFILGVAGIIAGGGFVLLGEQEAPLEGLLSFDTMELKSSAFEHQGSIPATYTCDGENINPPLEIAGVPEGAQSLALIMDDPDAPSGVFTHWTMWNIDPSTSEIPENSVPAGAVQGRTSFGRQGYGGPCPPPGTHRYFFKLYALNTVLSLNPEADKAQLETAMEGAILEKAELMGAYQRGD